MTHTHSILKTLCSAFIFLFVAANTQAATTDISNAPLVTSPNASVLPNIMYILDDSGSMGWDYLPDWVNDNPFNSYANLQKNAGFNGVYYDPATTYTPSVHANGTSYNSMTSANTSAWTSVPNDAYGVQSNSSSNLVGNAGYYTFIAGEYCTAPNLKTCNTQSAASTGYPYPAKLRWCSDTALTNCQAVRIETGTTTYMNARYPTAPTATLTLSCGGCSNTTVSSITVNGQQILSATTSPATTSTSGGSSLAQYITANINACTTAISGNCTIAGYSATRSGSTVIISAAPSVGNISVTPSITQSGNMSISAAAFTGSIPGSNLYTAIISGVTSYPYPGSATKASTRTDCAGSTCTYAEEMTNYANWWAYYHTRMQMMKTSASLAFAALGDTYRVGYLSINNNTGSDFLNLGQFNATQKSNWYTKFTSANPNNSTPLRTALTKAGRLYAGKYNGATLNGSTVTDPMQYSCQQNFAILSTDGYWNESSNPKQMDGTTDVGNQDGTEVRPYYDGASIQQTTTQIQQSQTQLQQSTSQLIKRTVQQQQQTSTLQKQITQIQQDVGTLQKRTSQLQASTSNLQKSTMYLQISTKSHGNWSAFTSTSTCTWGNSTQCQYATTSGGSTVWTASAASWANVSSCTTSYSSNTSSGTTWSGDGTSCRYSAYSTPANVSSCTTAAPSSNSPYTVATATSCSYTTWPASWTNTASCTPLGQSTSSPYTVGTATQCQYSWAAGQATPSCSTPAYVAGNYANATVYNNCQPVALGYANTASTCSVTTTPDVNGQTTQCRYWDNAAGATWSALSNVSSCTQVDPSPASPYSVINAVNCPISDVSVGASSCTPSSSAGTTITCSTVTTGPTPVASCTAQGANSGNNYTQTNCSTITIQAATGVSSCTASSANSGNGYVTTSCNTVTNTSNISSCTAQAASSANNWTATTCGAGSGGTSNTLADTAEYYYITDLRTPALSNCTSGSSGNTLCSTPSPASDPDPYNNVPKSGDDAASWQHMTTFTLGLGASGYMQYQSDYGSATSGDFFDVKNGTSAAPASGICSWQSSGVCNWPAPTSNTQTTIDDLWHAGVDGRGAYFSATNPGSLAAGLNGALSGISKRTGASAAATTSNPNVVTGDNFVFSSTFVSQDWTGQLIRQQLDLNTGLVSPTADWAARGQLDNRVYTTRTIYTRDPANTYNGANGTQLKLFTYTNLTIAEQAYFNTPAISSLSQFCPSGVTCLSAANQTLAAGLNLVRFLRGDRTNEGTSDNTKYYRTRKYLLGDIVDAEAAYVSKPQGEYADYGYTAFITANNSREGLVYVAANDGMLHAFYAKTDTTLGHVGGSEAWAYIPSLVLPNLYKLADKNYANQHQYYVDGTPVVGDICVSSCGNSSAVWKTILVGGLNAGGRGYYALDITDPANPIALWEYTDSNMGYSFGNPKIGKLKNGAWVVMLTSGYNNVSPGDGQGHLYVLNAYTGTLNTTVNPSGATPGIINTGVGDTATPSGLARIAARASNPTKDNTILAVYGGDLLGNIWRFDINGDVGATGYDAQLITTLQGPGGAIQPVTSKLEVGLVGSDVVLFAGTGRYLGASDLSDTSQLSPNKQSMYGIKDPLSTASTPATAIYANPRSTTCTAGVTTNCFVQQTYTSTTCPAGSPGNICSTGETVRTNSNAQGVNMATQYGWYADFPDSGERNNTDPALALGILGFTTNVPQSSACTVGGYSFVYFVDYRTGGPLSTSPTGVVGTKLGNSIATRPVFVKLPNGSVEMLIMTSDAGSNSGSTPPPASSSECVGDECSNTVPPEVFVPPQPTASTATRRTSWRELIKE